jgi:hypothetical protein
MEKSEIFSLKMVQIRGQVQFDPHPNLKLGTITGGRSLDRAKSFIGYDFLFEAVFPSLPNYDKI